MKHSKLMKTGLVLALSAATFQANAKTYEAGLNACAEAMVSDLAASQGAPMVYNLSSESDSNSKKMHRREVFHLDAMSPDGEIVVARMDCVVNGRAKVVRLISVPLDGEDARVRATTFN